jgi:ribosome-associated protein
MADPRPGDETSTPTAADDAQQFAVAAARIASDTKTEDVAVLDLRGISSLTDFFVIGTGTSDRQMRAVFDRIEEHADGVGRSPFRVTDRRATAWLLADYVAVRCRTPGVLRPGQPLGRRAASCVGAEHRDGRLRRFGRVGCRVGRCRHDVQNRVRRRTPRTGVRPARMETLVAASVVLSRCPRPPRASCEGTGSRGVWLPGQTACT